MSYFFNNVSLKCFPLKANLSKKTLAILEKTTSRTSQAIFSFCKVNNHPKSGAGCLLKNNISPTCSLLLLDSSTLEATQKQPSRTATFQTHFAITKLKLTFSKVTRRLNPQTTLNNNPFRVTRDLTFC